ncbi:MAG TPA: hypothetical protein VKR58_01370 [Aquella sp.]|nr:hypothetical protein [Aquella sp.]
MKTKQGEVSAELSRDLVNNRVAKKLFILLALATAFAGASAMPDISVSDQFGVTAHVPGEISTTENGWQISFTGISEASLQDFTDSAGNHIQQGLVIPVSQDYKYGFSFLDGADFDVAYVVTAVKRVTPAKLAGNPKCVLIVTAKSATVPQVSISNFQNAICSVYDTEKTAGHMILQTRSESE